MTNTEDKKENTSLLKWCLLRAIQKRIIDLSWLFPHYGNRQNVSLSYLTKEIKNLSKNELLVSLKTLQNALIVLQTKDRVFEIEKVILKGRKTYLYGYKKGEPLSDNEEQRITGLYFMSSEYKLNEKDEIQLKISTKNFAKKLEEYKNKIEINTTIPNNKKQIIFDKNKGYVIYKNRKCKIPYDTKQYSLCEIMFSKKINERISWDEIAESWKGYNIGKYNGKGEIKLKDWREVYDAVNAVNKKVKDKLEIDKIFKYKDKNVIRLK